MGRKCVKCSRKYDDTWGVCLFCGSRLEEEERKEAGTAEEAEKRTQSILLTMVISLLILCVFYLIYLAGAEYFDRIQKALFRSGRFPHVRFEILNQPN